MGAAETAERRTGYLLILGFTVLALGIVAGGSFYYRHYQQQFRDGVEHQLYAIAKLKADELAQYRKELMGDAGIFLNNDGFSVLVKRFLTNTNPEDVEAQRQIQEWADKFVGTAQYDHVRLLDVQGITRLSSPVGLPPVAFAAQRIPDVLRTNQVAVQDLRRKELDQLVYLGIMVPIFEGQDVKRPLGVFYLRIDPEKYLYPFIRRWPTPSLTAETLLVRRDGNDALYLNELKFRTNTALNLRISLEQTNVPAVRAVLGQTGIMQGLDYRQVPVIAALCAIADSPWFLVTKMDLAEVYAPLRERLRLTVLFVSLLVLGMGLGAGIFWRQQRVRFYKERAQVAEALRESEERFRRVFEEGPIGMTMLDQTFRFIRVNPAFSAMLEYPMDEMQTMAFPDITHPDQVPKDVEEVQRLLRGELSVYRAEKRCVTRSGKELWGLMHVSVVRNAAGAFRYFLAIISNITEHKRAEDELRLVSAALEVADSAIVITDRAGVIQWANLAFTTLTGYTQAEALGKNSSLLKSGKHEPAFYKSLWDTILSGRVWRGEMANRRKNGSVYSEEMTITPVRDGRGEIGHFIAIKQDITERKKLQAQLLRTQRLESVGRLASGIAHDLNNLLSPMLLAPQLLRESIQDPDLCSLLDLIETNARRGSDIIKQLLTFGRGVESERVPVQLRALVLDMAGIIRETFPKNITTRRETPAEAWLVKGDATQLHQILMNLCVNARDAMPEGGTLTLKLENQDIDESFARMIPGARPGRYVCLSVTDTGQGIAPEHLDKIYDPFFTTKELGQGTGLGLSTVLGIVQSHGGFIQVQSQPGHGTQFKVYLSASETAAASPASQADQPILQGHGELVLMVDDEESVRQVTRQFLECNGYRMIEAENGTTAVVQYAAHQQQVQVVVTDLIMPVMDGPAFIQVLRRMNPQVRVIVMSGQQDKPGLPADLRIPDEARLAKPFSGAMLLQTLHRVLHPEATPKN